MKYIPCLLILILIGCASGKSKEKSREIEEVGEDFKQSKIILKFHGKYLDKKVNKKEVIARGIKHSLLTVFQLGGNRYESFASYENQKLEENWKLDHEEESIMRFLMSQENPPHKGQSVLKPGHSNNDYFLNNAWGKEYKKFCRDRELIRCNGPLMTIWHRVKFKNEKHKTSIASGGLALDENRVVLPSIKIYEEHLKFLYPISFEKIHREINEFDKRLQKYDIRNLLLLIMTNSFSKCRPRHEGHVRRLECFINPDSKKIHEEQVHDKNYRLSVWGLIYALNSDIEVKWKDDTNFEIVVTVDTPKLYKKAVRVEEQYR